MKTLYLLLTSVALVAGCASAPKQSCILLKFPHPPSAAMVEQLAATQANTTPAEVAAWFAQGENFMLSSVHTNEIAAAIAEGATAKVIHSSSGTLLPPISSHR